MEKMKSQKLVACKYDIILLGKKKELVSDQAPYLA